MKRISLILLFLFSILLTNTTYAQDEYGIITEKSEFQRDSKKSYFDLRLKPGQKTTIAIVINNYGDKENTYRISANPAMTSSGVVIDYNNPNPKTDASMKHPFNKIAKVKTPDVKIPPRKAKRVEIEIQMPKEKFDGIILGGIHTSRILPESEKKGQTGYVNRLSYVSGVRISESDDFVKPSLKLNAVEVKEDSNNVAIVSNITNPTAINISPLTWKTEIKDLKNGKVIKEEQQKNAMVAPNTTFGYSIRFAREALKSGKYRMKITATLPDKREWVLTKDFDVTLKELETVNSEIDHNFGLKDSQESKKEKILLFSVLGGLLAIILSYFLFFGKRRKKREEDTEKELEELKRQLAEIQNNKK